MLFFFSEKSTKPEFLEEKYAFFPLHKKKPWLLGKFSVNIRERSAQLFSYFWLVQLFSLLSVMTNIEKRARLAQLNLEYHRNSAVSGAWNFLFNKHWVMDITDLKLDFSVEGGSDPALGDGKLLCPLCFPQLLGWGNEYPEDIYWLPFIILKAKGWVL